MTQNMLFVCLYAHLYLFYCFAAWPLIAYIFARVLF